MILTKELAKKYIGKYVDSYRRNEVHRGMFPKQIVQLSDESLYLRNPIGVYTRIEDEGFNSLDIDYIFDCVRVFKRLDETEIKDDTKI